MNCKPNGLGKWVFKNGNEITGAFQQEKAAGEEEEEEEDEQLGEDEIPIMKKKKKPRLKLTWASDSKLDKSSRDINLLDNI